ncbi:Uncharacterised protein [uncultured archaeon]|nr:Uncharacterised protein [uncultured archaeon]
MKTIIYFIPLFVFLGCALCDEKTVQVSKDERFTIQDLINLYNTFGVGKTQEYFIGLVHQGYPGNFSYKEQANLDVYIKYCWPGRC